MGFPKYDIDEEQVGGRTLRDPKAVESQQFFSPLMSFQITTLVARPFLGRKGDQFPMSLPSHLLYKETKLCLNCESVS